MGRLGPVESYPESALVLLTPRAGASLFDAGEDSDTLRMPLASVSVVRADEVSRTGVFTGLGVLFDVMIASWALFRVPHPFHPASH